MKQQSSVVQPFPQRLMDLIPRQSNEEIDAEIQRSSRERLANELFIDRRDPANIRTETQRLKNAEDMQRGNLDTTERKIVACAEYAAKLRKLLKAYEKQPVNLRTDGAILEAGERLSAAEKELEALKERAVRIEAGVKNAVQHQKEFLAFRPREGYPTNSELLKQYSERTQFERGARSM